MKTCHPDYHNSILNVSASILHHYGVPTKIPTLPIVDELLIQNKKHVVLILLDGLGVNVIQKHLSKKTMFRTNMVREITSVFPPTTVAATNSLLTGLPPISSGYLGWTQYFREYDANTVVFLNTDAQNPSKIFEKNMQATLFLEPNIFNQIASAQPDLILSEIFPSFRLDGFDSFEKQCERLLEITQTDSPSFTYVYWTEPDLIEHEKGINHNKTKKIVRSLNDTFENLTSNLSEDTLVMVIADHGLVNIKERSLSKYPEIMECLIRFPSMEPRCCTFFVKDSFIDVFPERFYKAFPKGFKLLSKNDFIASGLLGSGTKHPHLEDFIGDYTAIATDKWMLVASKSGRFKAHHAGLTTGEMMVPLIIYSK